MRFLLVLEAVSDSFFRACIRFWDNRFPVKHDPTELYREEIIYLRRKNDELIDFVLDASTPREVESTEASEVDFESIGKPIETSLQKRRRLEQESLANWNRMVQEAKDKAIEAASKKSGKSTSELEESLGVKN